MRDHSTNSRCHCALRSPIHGSVDDNARHGMGSYAVKALQRMIILYEHGMAIDHSRNRGEALNTLHNFLALKL